MTQSRKVSIAGTERGNREWRIDMGANGICAAMRGQNMQVFLVLTLHTNKYASFQKILMSNI